MTTIYAADLFAGGGGTSTGVAQACRELGRKVDLVAINHWLEAVETHTANHPWARHICQDLRIVNPEEAVPGGHLHLLVASPECIWDSRAAGGKPRNDQNRATAWDLFPWLERLKVDNMMVENVPEFADWGPRDSKGHKIKAKKGSIYQSWLHAIRMHGYNVDAKVLNAADYGAPTSRSRLFVLARKGNAPIAWPEPTHGKKWRGNKRWRPARQIIDWNLKGESIFTRKRPLSEMTIRRIVAGLRRFGGRELQPFLILMEHSTDGTEHVRSVEDPLPTITAAKGGSMAIAEPFMLSQGSGGAPRSVNDPVPTIPTDGAHALVEPVIVKYHGGKNWKRSSSIDKPLPTLDTANRYALAEPIIVPNFGEADGQKPRAHSVDDPLPAVTGHGAGALVEPFLLPVRGIYGSGNTPKSVDEPLGTITQRGYGAVVEPCIVQYNGQSKAQSVKEPLNTITTKDRFGLVEPYLLRFNGTTTNHIENSARSIEEPLDAVVSSSNHFALIQPEVDGRYLDIRFRMLQPHELSAAMGFPKGYAFKGTKTQVIKQIGNAVVVDVAKALVKSLLSPSPRGRLTE